MKDEQQLAAEIALEGSRLVAEGICPSTSTPVLTQSSPTAPTQAKGSAVGAGFLDPKATAGVGEDAAKPISKTAPLMD